MCSFKLIIFIGIIEVMIDSVYSNYYPQECTKSCAKSSCQMVSNPACSLQTPIFDQKTSIGALKCRECKQSTENKCIKDNLKKNFAIGGNNITAVYCNDEYLIVWSFGMPNHETHLEYIPRPPGGSDLPYEQSCVGRSFIKQHYTFKVPLKTTLLPETSKNILPGWPQSEVPLAGPIGVALNGVPIFPPLDDANKYVWDICEVDNCNAHVGKGGDYHYHGDPYGSKCLYSPINDENNHPGLYGYSLDGIPIYGRYTKPDQDNQSTPLDKCGGHTHGDYGYHYHSQVDTNGSFVKYMQGPSNCWRGDISKISNFWDTSGRQANYDNSKSNPRNTVASRTDLESLKPCCGSTDYYVNNGVSLNLVAGVTTATDSGASGSNPPPSGAQSNGSSSNPNNSSSITYKFTTKNNNPYMCSSMGIAIDNTKLTCAQADSDAITLNGMNILKCQNDGVIKCFAFASLGKTGGSCSGDPFSEDGNLNSDVVYLPNEIGNSAINQNTITFSLTQTTVNKVASGFPSQGPIPKLKVLAMCSTTTNNLITSSLSPGSSSNSNLKGKGDFLSYYFVILVVSIISILF